MERLTEEERILSDRRQLIGYEGEDNHDILYPPSHDNNNNNDNNYDEDYDYEEEEPFDCFDPVAAEAVVSKYMPWETKHPPLQTMVETRSPPRSPSSSPQKDKDSKDSNNTPSPPSLSLSRKSRPWRVDVMLQTPTTAVSSSSSSISSKGKNVAAGPSGIDAVERASVSWKQQMKERKQLYDLCGVTVDEEKEGGVRFIERITLGGQCRMPAQAQRKGKAGQQFFHKMTRGGR